MRRMTAVILQRVKYPHNLAAAIRAAACFGADHVFYTGNRFEFKDGDRLPREERMKGYRSVEFEKTERPFDKLPRGARTVCIELTPTSMPLTYYQHYAGPTAYVFGPEDGSVGQSFRGLCHEFVYIPAYHCLNLAAAINVVLAHRAMQFGLMQSPALTEARGVLEIPSVVGWDGK